jgi:DNA-binding response OmpR family regulator
MISDEWSIFIIESDEVLNQNFTNALLKDGYTVRSITDGLDAIRMLWAENFDVVVCDLKTPGINGFEVLQWLRAYRPESRMIVIGDADSSALRMQALESGAASFVEKPFDARVLREEVNRLRKNNGFSASLDSFDLLDVIQVMTMGRKSITLLVNTGLEERGILRFHNGDLVWAEYGILRGEEAFYALAAHKNGMITQQLWDEPVTPNVTQPLSRLILQALQYRLKYANRQQNSQQFSTELEAVRSATAPAPETDDTPFVFALDEQATPQAAASQQSFAASAEDVPLSSDGTAWWEQPSHTEHTGQLDHQTNGKNREANPDSLSAPTLTMTGEELQNFLKKMTNGNGSSPTGANRTTNTNGNHQQTSSQRVTPAPATSPTTLPSWLTGSNDFSRTIPPPTRQESPAPVNTTPATPPAASAAKPTPPPPTITQASPRRAPTTPSIENATPARTPHQDIFEESEVLRPSPPDWEDMQFSSTSIPALHSPSIPDMAIANAASSIDGRGTSSNGNNASSLQPYQPQASVASPNGHGGNYAALVSALQSLGYAAPGFIAAALMTVDGQAIAHVSIDETDIVKQCQYFNSIQKTVVSMLQQEGWGDYEHTIITSAGRHLLLRAIRMDAPLFQVVLTSHEITPAECLQLMQNIEGAIRAAYA